MMVTGTTPRLQSWIPPSFAWTTAPEVFCIEAPLSDPDLVEFISTGTCEIDVCGSKRTRRVIALLTDEKPLRRQLREAVWATSKLKPVGSRIKAGTKVVAHCNGVFLLPDGKTLCVVVGRSKPVAPDAWISAGLKAEADALLFEHRSKVAEFDEAISRKKKDNEDFYARNGDMKKFEGFAEAQVAKESHFQRPVLTAERLVPSMPRAAKFPRPTSGHLERLTRAATAAIAASGWPPSRDGNFTGILPGPAGSRAQGLVSWMPHTGLPSYPEVRWAVQRRLPAALRKPRSDQMGKPKFETDSQPVEDSAQVQGFDPTSNDLKDTLDDLQLDQSDYRNRVDDVRKDSKGQERVYQALRETPDWLEEALANWAAWSWFKTSGIQSLVTRIASNAESLDRVVEASLDLAPPGYQEWRLGHQPGTWRTFANQLSTGNPKINATVIGLPLESALIGPLPYDFQPADIPLRFVGPGVIADRLQCHPATFNVPPRRELERALKHFRHSLDASGGKGGHQKWTGPDRRAFILPTRDLVSAGVFKTFLHHVGIDKATYVRQVRPNL